MSKRYYFRERVEGWRRTFASDNGDVVVELDLQSKVHFTEPGWYDAETHQRVMDDALVKKLDGLMQKRQEGSSDVPAPQQQGQDPPQLPFVEI